MQLSLFPFCVPAVPILGVVRVFYLMFHLPLLTGEVVGIWLVIGLGIGFTYSIRHSKVQVLRRKEEVVQAR